jgi:hypothetical protein
MGTRCDRLRTSRRSRLEPSPLLHGYDMLEPRNRILLYEHHEEPLLRRLGGAVVSHWASLPPTLQTQLLEQACLIFDRVPSATLENDMRRFVDRYMIRREA